MKFDISKPHCYYFNEICKIPHGSYNEKALSDYIVQFAKDLGLKWKQDEMWNVIVYKDKNGDYSDESLILQAHIDMVCEKNKSTVHDFEKDPIKLYVDEEGWLHADGTTLGADDGHGCAYMMAILADKEMKHPALECVFTVQEEVGLCGSMIIKKEDLKSNRMVSLDGGGEVTTSLCSAAGARVKLIKTIETKVNTKPAYTLSVLGLLGGHSGGEIHKEKGNSNKLLVRILMELKLAGCDVELGFIEGGLKANAIPREATCIFASDTAKDTLETVVRRMDKDIQTELEYSDAGFFVEFKETISDTVFTDEVSSSVIDALYLAPNGFQARSMAIEGLTQTSLNLGVLDSNDGKVTAEFSIRSAIGCSIDDFISRLSVVARVCGFEVEQDSRYPNWSYSKDSPMRDAFNEIVLERTGKPLELHAGHGGNECGVFKALNPKMDIVSMGPITQFIHTPDEKMDLASFDRTFENLKTMITRLK